jgi:hypothetical protein
MPNTFAVSRGDVRRKRSANGADARFVGVDAGLV